MLLDKMSGGNGDIEDIFKVLDAIWQRKETPDLQTLNNVLMMCAKTGELLLAFNDRLLLALVLN